MGCGCGKKKSSSMPMQTSMPAASLVASPAVEPAAISVASKSAPAKVESTDRKDCFSMYPLLAQMDKKAIAIINKTNVSDREVNLKAREANRQIRQWIGTLRAKCPDERQVAELDGWIKDNYFKYYQQ